MMTDDDVDDDQLAAFYKYAKFKVRWRCTPPTLLNWPVTHSHGSLPWQYERGDECYEEAATCLSFYIELVGDAGANSTVRWVLWLKTLFFVVSRMKKKDYQRPSLSCGWSPGLPRSLVVPCMMLQVTLSDCCKR
jgi:hypothetical protein